MAETTDNTSSSIEKDIQCRWSWQKSMVKAEDDGLEGAADRVI